MNTFLSSLKQNAIYLILSLITLVVLTWMLLPQKHYVKVERVKYGRFTQYIDEDAKTRASNIYTITAPVSGVLQRIDHLEGDLVQKNEILATIKPPTPTLHDVRTTAELNQQLGSAEDTYKQIQTELERAHAALMTASSDLDRIKPLAKSGHVSKQQYEHTMLAYQLKQKDYASTESKLHAAQHQIDQLKASLVTFSNLNSNENAKITLLSPITGKILKIDLKSETTTAPGNPIMEIADVNQLEIVADILSTDAVLIPKHTKVIIKRWGGELPLEGRVRVIEPSAFTKISALGVEEQRVNVIIDITSPHDTWKALGNGYRVDVSILIHESPRELLVPMSALLRDGNDWIVYLDQHSKAIKRKIIINRHNPDVAVVEKGLTEGDSVVIYPSSLLREGMRISSTE